MRERISVGVDLGGTNVRAAVVDGQGGIVAISRAKLGKDRSPAAVIRLMCATILDALGRAGNSLYDAAGVGVGVAAQLRGESGVVALAPNLGWKDVPFGEMLQQALGRSVRVVNDVEAITWGEVTYGAARGHREVLVVFAGTGVGGGMVFRGQSYRGAAGVAAEIGHTKVVRAGSRCGCGGRGCLEAYLGGANLSRRLRRLARGWTALSRAAGGDPERIHPGLLEDLDRKGDRKARRLIEELALHLGTALANAVTLLNPSALVLGGKVLAGCPTLRRLSEQVLRERTLDVSSAALSVLDAALGDDAGVIGSAALVK